MSSPCLYGVLKDNVGRRGLLQRRPCEPNWLRRSWPGAQIAAPGSWEEQTGGRGEGAGGDGGEGRLVCVRSDGAERRGRQINRQREEWERRQNDKCASGGDGGGIIRCVSIINLTQTV